MAWMLRLVTLAIVLLTATASAASPPNVVMIISDDQAWTDFGFMGHESIETPRLDRLATESLVFPHGYVPASLCSPSLLTIITGRFPFEHGVTGNEPPRPRGKPRNDPTYRAQVEEMIAYIDKSPTLPRLLAKRGYLSFQSGKWWLGEYTRGGFTHGMTHGDPDRGGRHGDAGLAIGRTSMQPIFDFIEEAGDRPFFVWYAPFLPHRPHDPPKHMVEKYSAGTESIHVARYRANCELFDTTCGQLLDHLDERGLRDNTLVVFVVDNGWIQRADAPGYAPRSKRSPYDGGLRTPIMLRWPGHVQPGTIETPVSSIDLASTVLAACGMERDAAMSGIDLLDAEAIADRTVIFGDVHLHNAVDIHRPAANVVHRWCRSGRWKLIVPNPVHRPDARIELYDITADPFETTDLAASEPDRVATMRALIDGWWSAD
jgi:uncharacterized sulfatase